MESRLLIPRSIQNLSKYRRIDTDHQKSLTGIPKHMSYQSRNNMNHQELLTGTLGSTKNWSYHRQIGTNHCVSLEKQENTYELV